MLYNLLCQIPYAQFSHILVDFVRDVGLFWLVAFLSYVMLCIVVFLFDFLALLLLLNYNEICSTGTTTTTTTTTTKLSAPKFYGSSSSQC